MATYRYPGVPFEVVGSGIEQIGTFELYETNIAGRTACVARVETSIEEIPNDSLNIQLYINHKKVVLFYVGKYRAEFSGSDCTNGYIIASLIQVNSDFSLNEWMNIIFPHHTPQLTGRNKSSDAFAMKKTKELAKWADVYRQKPIEKGYLTDIQKNRLHKLLLEAINTYFISEETRMSFNDFTKIDEIIIDVLNGE